MSDIQSIIKKIKALRARAVDTASTEAEAAIALRVAAKLLAEHNLSFTEVEARAEGIVKETWTSGKKTRPPEGAALFGIDALCKTKSYYSGGTITVLGAPADVEVALYFLDIVFNAARVEALLFQLSDEYDRLRSRGESVQSINWSFKNGLARRVGERLKAMAAETEYASTGTDLVVVKNALIREYMAQHGIYLRSGGSKSVNGAYGAGKQSGDGVSLNRGVGSGRSGQLRLT